MKNPQDKDKEVLKFYPICPKCKKRMLKGRVIHTWNSTVGYHCPHCSIVARNRIHPQTLRGIEIAEDYEDIHFMDKRITKLPTMVQIGILRARQHAKYYGYKGKDGYNLK